MATPSIPHGTVLFLFLYLIYLHPTSALSPHQPHPNQVRQGDADYRLRGRPDNDAIPRRSKSVIYRPLPQVQLQPPASRLRDDVADTASRGSDPVVTLKRNLCTRRYLRAVVQCACHMGFKYRLLSENVERSCSSKVKVPEVGSKEACPVWRDEKGISFHKVRTMMRAVLEECGGGNEAQEMLKGVKMQKLRGKAVRQNCNAFPHLCRYLGLLGRLNNILDGLFGRQSSRARRVVVMKKGNGPVRDKKLRLMRYNNIRTVKRV